MDILLGFVGGAVTVLIVVLVIRPQTIEQHYHAGDEIWESESDDDGDDDDDEDEDGQPPEDWWRKNGRKPDYAE